MNQETKDYPIKLNATNAKEARAEIKRLYLGGASYAGYDEDGNCVLLSLVRPRYNTANVATVTKNRSKPAVKFRCSPTKCV